MKNQSAFKVQLSTHFHGNANVTVRFWRQKYRSLCYFFFVCFVLFFIMLLIPRTFHAVQAVFVSMCSHDFTDILLDFMDHFWYFTADMRDQDINFKIKFSNLDLSISSDKTKKLLNEKLIKQHEHPHIFSRCVSGIFQKRNSKL